LVYNFRDNSKNTANFGC